jgi:hypothetical protein
MEEPDLATVRPLLFDYTQQSLWLSQQLYPLLMRAEVIRKKSLLRLTIANLLGKY